MEMTRQLDLEFILLRPEVTYHPSDVCAHVLLFILFMLLILGSTFYEVRVIPLYSRKPFIHFSYVHYFGGTI